MAQSVSLAQIFGFVLFDWILPVFNWYYNVEGDFPFLNGLKHELWKQ